MRSEFACQRDLRSVSGAAEGDHRSVWLEATDLSTHGVLRSLRQHELPLGGAGLGKDSGIAGDFRG